MVAPVEQPIKSRIVTKNAATGQHLPRSAAKHNESAHVVEAEQSIEILRIGDQNRMRNECALDQTSSTKRSSLSINKVYSTTVLVMTGRLAWTLAN